MSKEDDAKASQTYREICSRLNGFDPPIDLDRHIDGNLTAHATTLDGITFWPKDHSRLIDDLKAAKTRTGETAFEDGGLGEASHWAVKLSFASTEGSGFRERRYLSDDPPSLADAMPNRVGSRWSTRFGAQFSDSPIDLSSLHCGVAKALCNIHIDGTGFVIATTKGDVIVGPDFLQHLVNELFLKTKAKKALDFIPGWVFDRLSIILPNSANDFSGASQRRDIRKPLDLLKLDVGLSFDVVKAIDYKMTVKAMCSLPNCTRDWSVTVTIGGRHDVGSW